MITEMTDKKLCIKTEDIQTDSNHSYYNHRYEPTSYEFLDCLFNEYILSPNDSLVDFGSGMGRLNFCANWRFHCHTVGIELNETYYKESMKNLSTYIGPYKQKIQYKCMAAQNYMVTNIDNYFYFFNPFSIEIFRQVISNILYSLEEAPRDCTLLLYYPDLDYIFFLDKFTCFELVEEIKVAKTKDKRNCFYIYKNLIPR